ncbi:MAG: hypothetical protein ABIS67_04880 [Candidatus Eisenbacteria bacterium]
MKNQLLFRRVAAVLMLGAIATVFVAPMAAAGHGRGPAQSGYSYVDPYCEVRYTSLDRYQSHLRGCGHPNVVRVMERDRCVREMAWRNGDWAEYRGDWRSYGSRGGGWSDHPAHRWFDGRLPCGGKFADGRWRNSNRCEDQYGRKKVNQMGGRWEEDGYNDRHSHRDGDRRWKDDDHDYDDWNR